MDKASRSEADETRTSQLGAALREVLVAFTAITINSRTAFRQMQHPIAPEDFERWHAVLNPPEEKGR
jgi:hypothetical protein